MDRTLRMLERSNNKVSWIRAKMRAGQFTSSEVHGPRSILEEECNSPDCSNHLKWSNCPYCPNCHYHHSCCRSCGFYQTIGTVSTGASSIRKYSAQSCFTIEKNNPLLV